MKTVGFVISNKENEFLRALLPEDISLVNNKKYLFFEKGYGLVLGIPDEEYIKAGANISPREEILRKDVICDPKIGDADYLTELNEGQGIFGWVHAVQNRMITDTLIQNKLTVLAWEDMFEENRHVFWKNNELAGEAAVLHAFTLYGKMPSECKVAIIGRGNIARGAMKVLYSLGAKVTIYDRKTVSLLATELENYDVIVNGTLWDTDRKDHIIYRRDLKKMKPMSMIIDISCDTSGAIETSSPTTIENPVYRVDSVLHYVVDHTPSLVHGSASKSISIEVSKYIDYIIEENTSNSHVLHKSLIVDSGLIIDQRIINFQNR